MTPEEGLVADLSLPDPDSQAAPSWRLSFPAMGTRIDVVGHGGDFEELTDALCARAMRLESLWSVFRPSSEISRINAAAATAFATGEAAGEWTPVDGETDRLLVDSVRLSRATGGAFTPVIGALVRAWDVKGFERSVIAGGRVPPVPSEAVRAGAIRASSVDLLERDDAGRWRLVPVESGDARTGEAGAALVPSVDLGGIAKGAAADAMRDLAVERGADGVLISIGTSSVAAAGTRADGEPWRVGLRDPNGPESRWIGSIPLADGMSLSTSGDNLASLPALAGADHPLTRHHILDPVSGMPSRTEIRQASILCASGIVAEAVSTAVLVAGTAILEAQAFRAVEHVVMREPADGPGRIVVEATPGARWRPRRRSSS